MNARRDPLSAAVDRRRFLKVGGFTVATGALIAACGDRGGDSGVPRVGTVPSTTALPTAGVTDVALLRTATSLEYNLLFSYQAIKDLGALDADQQAIADAFAADHQAHADELVAATIAIGGEPYACPNPRMQEVYIAPSLLLIYGSEAASSALGLEKPVLEVKPSPDQQGDSLTFLQALESLSAATYQAMMVQLNDKSLRPDNMSIGCHEAQHSSTWALVINPEQIVATDVVLNPETISSTSVAPTGETTVPATSDTEADAGAAQTKIVVYALPATFGQLTPIQLQLGAPNDSGIVATLSYETPSLNSLAYEYMGACEEE